MKITILPFGILTDVLTPGGFAIEEETIATVAQLHSYLSEKYPAISQQKFRYAVNQQLANLQHPLQSGDEIALLPPFSGG